MTLFLRIKQAVVMHQMTCAVTSQANIVVNGISIEKSTASCCASVFLHPTNALLGKKFSPVWANSYQLQSSQSRTMIQPTPYLTHQKRHLHGWPTNYSCLPFFNVANIHRTRTKPERFSHAMPPQYLRRTR